MTRRRVTILLDVETDLDDPALDARVSMIVDESDDALRDQRVLLKAFVVEVSDPPKPEPYGVGIDGPEVGQGIDAPWLDPPDSERTQRADYDLDQAKDAAAEEREP